MAPSKKLPYDADPDQVAAQIIEAGQLRRNEVALAVPSDPTAAAIVAAGRKRRNEKEKAVSANHEVIAKLECALRAAQLREEGLLVFVNLLKDPSASRFAHLRGVDLSPAFRR
jgi:hypothetical protein